MLANSTLVRHGTRMDHAMQIVAIAHNKEGKRVGAEWSASSNDGDNVKGKTLQAGRTTRSLADMEAPSNPIMATYPTKGTQYKTSVSMVP